MKRVSRITAVSSIILLLIAGMLAGCATKVTTTAGTTATTQQLAPYEIIFAFPGDAYADTPAVEAAMSAITKEKINATLKLMPIGWAAWAQQTTLMVAGNEKIDAIFSSNYFNYSSVVARGDFLPIENLLDQYGKDIKAVVEPDILTCSNIGGHMYAVPSIRDFAADFGVVMRKDLVDKYSIDLTKVKTYADLSSVYDVIKKNEPNVIANVKGGDITTFAEQVIQSKFDRLDNWFGVLPMDAKDLTVVNMYETQTYKDAVNLVRSWFLAGYISKDAATSTEQGVDVIKAGRGFSIMTPLKPGIELQRSAQCATTMVAVSLTKPITNTSNVANVMTSISKTTGNAERAMMFLNLMYSNKELVNLYDNGVEGKDYVKQTDPIIDYPTGVTAANTGYLSCNWMVGNNFMSYIWKGDDPNLWGLMKEFNKSSVRSAALGFSFNAEPVKTELAAVSNVLSQYKSGLETGTLDPVVTLPEFQAKLKEAGIDAIIAEKQKQLNAWAAAK